MAQPAPSSADKSRTVVSFQHVRVRFGGETVLEDISFEIRRGEFVCLLGPSGCGKTTSLRLIGQLLDLQEGTVSVDGQPPARAWEKLAYVFQSPRLVHWRTALENVLLGLELRHGSLPKEERLRRALLFLRLVGLEQDAHKYPGVLSGGERQRVALARALAVDPEVILMDEPLANLDIHTKQRLRDEVLSIWRATQKTVVFVTHDLEEALYLADRVILYSNKPTRVLKTYELHSPRPRAVDIEPEVLAIEREIRSHFSSQANLSELWAT